MRRAVPGLLELCLTFYIISATQTWMNYELPVSISVHFSVSRISGFAPCCVWVMIVVYFFNHGRPECKLSSPLGLIKYSELKRRLIKVNDVLIILQTVTPSSMFFNWKSSVKMTCALPESAPAWQCWGLRWTSDGWDSRWDTGPLSSHSAGLPLAPTPPSWRFSAPFFPVWTSPTREPCRSSACRLRGAQAAAPLLLAGKPPGESGLLHCPAIRH